MDIEPTLEKEANWLAKSLGHKAHPHHLEQDVIEYRLLGYRPKINRDFQCPACWIEHERRSNLDPIPTNTRDDALECDVCGASYLIPR